MSLDKIFGELEPKQKLQTTGGYNLIDFSQLVVSTFLTTYKPGDEMSLDLVRHMVINSLRYNVLSNKKKYPNIIICIDNANGGYWRRKLAYYYKKHRTEQREESGYDWETIYLYINTVVQEIKENLPYKVISIPGVEADDIIAVMVKEISQSQPGVPILITSSDGDFTQLHKFKNVTQWSPIQKKWVKTKTGSPRHDLLTKIVKGDGKDTISNVYSPSDFIITKQEGQRQKSISSKFMEQVFAADDPKALFTGDALTRYNENEVLLDFDFIPADISESILNEFRTVQVAPRRMIYPFFVKNRMVQLLDKITEF